MIGGSKVSSKFLTGEYVTMFTRILILSILGNIMAYSLACAQQPNVEDIGTEFEQSLQLLDQLTESYGRLDRRL